MNAATSSAASVIVAGAVKCAASCSHRHVEFALADFYGIERGVLERAILGKNKRRRAHALRLWFDAGGRLTLLHRLRGLPQAQARHDDRVVGGDKVLLAAVRDRPHALLHGGILDREPLHPAVIMPGLLRRAIHQIAIAAIGDRSE